MKTMVALVYGKATTNYTSIYQYRDVRHLRSLSDKMAGTNMVLIAPLKCCTLIGQLTYQSFIFS